MRLLRDPGVAVLVLGLACAALVAAPSVGRAATSAAASPDIAVGPQYDTAHVYVAPKDFDGFLASFVATFGGKLSARGEATVTPTPSKTLSQVAFTPAGPISVFGYETPVPYPFGAERTGYLVTDMDAAVASARANGANIVVEPFNDPIGRDAIIEWPGGVYMQLYWHTVAPQYAPLATIPENRVYVSRDKADEFVRDFTNFAHGKVVEDVAAAPGIEIGRPADTYRRIRVESAFGKILVLVTDGHLPFPCGRETMGYEVPSLTDTLAKAQAAGATLVVPPYDAGRCRSAFVQFPGGYVAEIHSC